MNLRRALSALLLVVLLFAPFGRMAVAEAMPHHTPAAAPAAGHCEGDTAPEPDGALPAEIGCMIACATVATPAAAQIAVPPVPAAPAPVAASAARFHGLNPCADPPPPRRS